MRTILRGYRDALNVALEIAFRIKALRAAGALVVAAVLAIGGAACSKEEPQTKSDPDITLNTRLLYSPEATAVIQNALDVFGERAPRIADGSRIQVSGSPYEGLSAAAKLVSGEVKAAIWLAPSSAVVQMARLKAEGSTVSFTDCASLFSTVPAAGFRESDAFTVEEFGESLDYRSLLYPRASPAEPVVLMGVPGQAASSSATLLQLAAVALERPVEQLTASDLRSNLPKIQETQQKIAQYVASDDEMLEWLRRQEGGQPVVALTTEQIVKSASQRPGGGKLLYRTASVPTHVLDYPICIVNAPWLSPQEQTAARMLQSFLMGSEVAALWEKGGFRGPNKDPGAVANPAVAESLRFLADNWTDIRRPLLLTIVVDTSNGMTTSNLETIKRELELFFSTTDGGTRGPTAIISSSTRAELITDFTPDNRLLRAMVSKLRSSGGSSFRDGLLRAIMLENTTSYPDHRRAILFITAGKDTSSTASIDAVRTEIEQVITRKRLALYVIGIGSDPNAFLSVPQTIEMVGGRFIMTPIENFAKTMFPLWRELR